MPWEAWAALALLIIAVLAIVRKWKPPVYILLGVNIVLILLGILTPTQFLNGFSHEVILSIVLLSILGKALEVNGVLPGIFTLLMKKASTEWRFLWASIFPVEAVAAFLNPSSVALQLTPIIRRGALIKRFAPSRFLLLMSFAANLGGYCTLIGSVTNLIVQGLLQMYHPEAVLSFFAWGKMGLPLALIGGAYLVIVSKGMPVKTDPMVEAVQNQRNYTAEWILHAHSPWKEKRVGKIPFRIVAIERGDVLFEAPEEEFILQEKDRIAFAGSAEELAEIHAIAGLQAITDPYLDLLIGPTDIVEAVISPDSNLIGKTLKEIHFRNTYGAAVLGVYREGKRIERRSGETVLHAGDALVLIIGEDWGEKEPIKGDLFILPSQSTPHRLLSSKGVWATLFFVALVFATAAGISLPIAALIAVLANGFFQTLTLKQMQQAIFWDGLLLLGCAFGFTQAVHFTGLAHYSLAILPLETNPHMLVGILLCASMIGTQLLPNKLTAFFLFPFALEMGLASGYHTVEALQAMAVSLAIGASSSFTHPVSSKPLTLALGAGGYQWQDITRLGLPLNLLAWILGTIFIPLIWRFH